MKLELSRRDFLKTVLSQISWKSIQWEPSCSTRSDRRIRRSWIPNFCERVPKILAAELLYPVVPFPQFTLPHIYPTRVPNIKLSNLQHVFNRIKQTRTDTFSAHAFPILSQPHWQKLRFVFPCIVFNRQSTETIGKISWCYDPEIHQMKVTLLTSRVVWIRGTAVLPNFNFEIKTTLMSKKVRIKAFMSIRNVISHKSVRQADVDVLSNIKTELFIVSLLLGCLHKREFWSRSEWIIRRHQARQSGCIKVEISEHLTTLWGKSSWSSVYFWRTIQRQILSAVLMYIFGVKEVKRLKLNQSYDWG
jgi:hypothetical protein